MYIYIPRHAGAPAEIRNLDPKNLPETPNLRRYVDVQGMILTIKTHCVYKSNEGIMWNLNIYTIYIRSNHYIEIYTQFHFSSTKSGALRNFCLVNSNIYGHLWKKQHPTKPTKSHLNIHEGWQLTLGFLVAEVSRTKASLRSSRNQPGPKSGSDQEFRKLDLHLRV